MKKHQVNPEHVTSFLSQTADIAKSENESHLKVILFNVKHGEASVKQLRRIIQEIRVEAPLLEAAIRPLKIHVRNLTKQPVTAETRKQLSESAKKLNSLRSVITTAQNDLVTFRKNLREEHERLGVCVEGLRQYYNENPEQPAQVAAAVNESLAS